MSFLTTSVIVVGVLGSALIGGVFFAFSSFVMKALARVPAAQGIAAMQAVNVTVLNWTFLGAFMGTAAVSLLIVGLTFYADGQPAALCFAIGSLLYLLGTFVVTVVGNVPLNNQLAELQATDPGSVAFWEQYLDRWTRLNTVRTASAMCAALLLSLGLVLHD